MFPFLFLYAVYLGCMDPSLLYAFEVSKPLVVAIFDLLVNRSFRCIDVDSYPYCSGWQLSSALSRGDLAQFY